MQRDRWISAPGAMSGTAACTRGWMSKRKAFTAELNHAERAQQGAYRREVADGGDDGHDQ